MISASYLTKRLTESSDKRAARESIQYLIVLLLRLGVKVDWTALREADSYLDKWHIENNQGVWWRYLSRGGL